jgi:hypothetical protein
MNLRVRPRRHQSVGVGGELLELTAKILDLCRQGERVVAVTEVLSAP